MYKERRIFDALYGVVRFPDYVWDAMLSPEVQRLREIRLCNTSSLGFTGGANINRYEHSVGTAYLAMKWTEAYPWNLDAAVRRRFVLSALLHDIGSAPFGHSIQYVISRRGFEHEALYDIVTPHTPEGTSTYRYQAARIAPIYFGLPKRLWTLIQDGELKDISSIVAGRLPLGPLINGTIDLDNIDNVYRLAFHIGLVQPSCIPLRLAQSIWMKGDKLVVDARGVDYIYDWYETRRTLYQHLLLNPDEFSAKCMIGEAIEIAQSQSPDSFFWHDVDYQLMERLRITSIETKTIVQRLAIGDLYGCAGIFSTPTVNIFQMLSDPAERRRIEVDLSSAVRSIPIGKLENSSIAVHAIRDVNKTQRQIRVYTTEDEEIVIGRPTCRILIGVFFRNAHLSMTAISDDSIRAWKVGETARNRLMELLGDTYIEALNPYAEISTSSNPRHS